MKYLIILILGFFINALSAGPVMTGKSIVDSEKAILYSVPINDGKLLLEREVLQNPGFETSSLYPWTTNNWIVDTINPHKGRYCASVVGNYWIRQNIIPIHSTRINRISFWARQPDYPAAQAYDFIYNDSTFEEFVHFPTADWVQYDVTTNLNPQKILVAFQLWGYSGGGPNPDSTYIDDVSITRIVDVSILTIFPSPGDTFQLYDTIRPRIRLSNYGSFAESLWVWCRIEHTESTHIYHDSSLIRSLGPGSDVIVDFAPWTPRYTGQHRFRFELSPTDTTPWFNFWIVEGSAVKEQNNLIIDNKMTVRPTVGKSFELICVGEHKLPKDLKIYNSVGELIWSRIITGKEPAAIKWYGKDHLNRSLSPGVYLLRYGDVAKRIILTR